MTIETGAKNKTIVNALYKLADLRQNNRCDAVKEVLTELDRLQPKQRLDALSYCLERLIKGLASARLAARVGYSTAFCEVLKKFNEIPIPDVVSNIEKYLPIEKDNQVKENALGRVLSLMSLIRTINDAQISEELCSKVMTLLMELYEKYSHLQTLVVETIIILCSKVDENSFATQIWPHIKSHCQCSLNSLTAEKLYMIFELKKIYPKFITKHSKISTFKDSSLLEDSSNITTLTNTILSVSESCPVVHPGVVSFFEAVILNDDWLPKVWPSLFETGILKHEHRTIVCYGFQVLTKLLPFLKNENQIKIILSKTFFETLLKALVERNPTFRFSRHYATEFVEQLCKFVEKSNFLAESILRQIFDVSMNFDRLANVKLVRKIISNFKDDSADRLLTMLIDRVDFENDKCFDAESSLKFVFVIFSNNAKNQTLAKKVLNFLAELLFDKLCGKTSESGLRSVTAGVFFDCLCMLCDFSVKRRTLSIGFNTNKAGLLEDLLKTYQEKVKDDSSKLIKRTTKAMKKIRQDDSSDDIGNGFALLLGYFGLWTLYKPKEYQENLQEILTCYEECYANNSVEDGKDSWLDVLVDFFLSVLSKPSRHFKIPIDVAFYYLSKRLKIKHLEPIFKVLTTDDAETMEMDDEFDPITDEDPKSADQSESESESDNDDDIDEEEEESEDSFNVDPKFRSDLEKTLNLKTTTEDEDDAESVSSDFSDDTMFRLDAQLAEVFRQHLKDKTANAKALEEAERFRIQALDLILIFIRSTSDVELLVQTILPLLNAVKMVCLTKTASALTGRIVTVVQLICDKSKTNSAWKATDEKVFVQCLVDVLREIFEISKSTPNSMLQRCCSNSLRFILKLGDSLSNEDTKLMFMEQLAALVDRNLNDFLTDSLCLSSVSIFETIFEKHWRHFWYLLPQLAQVIFNDDDVRLFRRKATCTLCHCFIRHYQTIAKESSVDDKSIKKPLKKFCLVFRKHLIPIFKQLSTMFQQKKAKEEADESESKENSVNSLQTKPHYLAMIFKLLLPILRELDSQTVRKYFKIESAATNDVGAVENDEFVESLRNLIIASNRWKKRDNRFRKFDRSIEQECKRHSKRIFRDIMKFIGYEVEENGTMNGKSSTVAAAETRDKKVEEKKILTKKRASDEQQTNNDVNETKKKKQK